MRDVLQWSEQLNKAGVSLISFLQTQFPDCENFFLGVTDIANPHHVYSVMFPLVSVVHTQLAVQVLTTAVLTDWFNMMLKWLLMGHRPFWWVRETTVYRALTAPELVQTSATCETGPGTPSGHVMMCSSIGYVLIHAIVHQLVTPTSIMRVLQSCMFCSLPQKKYVAAMLWALYATLVILVSLSRLYVATHFPHQCLLGMICGIIVARMVVKNISWWEQLSKRRMLFVAAGLVVVATGAYWLQKAVGIDPQWSVRLAFKWCMDPDYLKVNTTPMYTLVKSCGTGLGLALSVSSQPYHNLCPNYPQTFRVPTLVAAALCTVIVLIIIQFTQGSIPTADWRVFYLCHYGVAAFLPYMLITIVPQLVSSTTKPRSKQD